ncbi:MAG TPA: PaaI family thioesterase [Pyrinomonadaceae bacterium]|jgi:uncharacterized protein (TIGR00369 family)
MKTDQLTPDEQRRIQEAFENVPFAHLIGMELGEVTRGVATLRLAVRDNLRQNRGVVHGGVTASLIDTAAAFAILTLLEPGQSTTTIDLTIHYLRPLFNGQAMARARVLRAGRRLIVVAVDIVDEAENLVATALTSYLRLA